MIQAEQLPSARTRQASCDGAPCLVTVELTGNRQIPSAELFAAMRVLEAEAFDQDTLESDELKLNALYYDRGFLEVQIPDPTVDRGRRSLGGGAVRIRFSIDEGIQYRIRSLDVYEDRAGLRCPPMGGWSTPLRPGDVFDRARLVSDLVQLQRTYRDQGYADVAASPATELDPEHRDVAVKVAVVRGVVRSFGRVRIAGNERTTRAELLRRIEVVEGARFSETVLDRSKARLLETGLFDRVDLSIEQGEAPASYNVLFEVSERPPPLSPAPEAPPVAPPSSPAKAPEPASDTRGCRALPAPPGETAPSEISARHILVMHAGSKAKPEGVTRSRDEALGRAREALAKLRGGAKFEAVVQAYSDEPGAADRHGELGRFDREVMVQKFSDAAFVLRVGEVSEVVETVYGFHIIQRTE